MRSRTLVLVAGLAEAIYLAASLRLPWPRYGRLLTSWHAVLSSGPGAAAGAWENRAFVLCAVAALALVAAYLLGWRVVRRTKVSRGCVWTGVLLFATTLYWTLPVTSDLFGYLVQSHQFTDLGLNPLLVAADQARSDPIVQAYRSVYSARPSVYGPAWLLASAPATIGRWGPLLGLAYLKGLILVSFLGSAWLLQRILRHLRPQAAVEGLYLFAWNPLVLWMAAGDGHNDLAMVVVLLLACWCLCQKRWTLAFALVTLSIWIKFISLLVLPLFLYYFWGEFRASPLPCRFRALGRVALAMVGVSVLSLAPFGNPTWLYGLAARFIRPINWDSSLSSVGNWSMLMGLALFSVGYVLALSGLMRKGATLERVLDVSFLVVLLAFVAGFARSQPWHLIWPAALAGLSRQKWAWPAVAGLSAVMMLAQLWVEWGAPGLSIRS